MQVLEGCEDQRERMVLSRKEKGKTYDTQRSKISKVLQLESMNLFLLHVCWELVLVGV
jgi:hypothetical protein